MSLGFVDIEILIPDPTTGRGLAVNSLTMNVYSETDVQLATYTLDSGIEAVQTLLRGVVYVHRDFDIRDAGETPGSTLKVVYSATIGAVGIGPLEEIVRFSPAARDAITGVLLSWTPEKLPELGLNSGDVEFYEIRRCLSPASPSGRTQTQFSPGMYTTGFYSFDDSLDDEASPPDNLTGVDYETTDGIINRAVRFNGYGRLTDGLTSSKYAFPANQDFSISVWVRPIMGQPGTFGFVAGKMGDFDYGYGIVLEKVANEIYPAFFIGGANYQYYKSVSTTIVDGFWHHLVLAVDRDDLAKLYLDGEKVAELDIKNTQSTDFSLYTFGVGAIAGGSHVMMGDVDELIVFNGVLTDLDVDLLYKQQYGISNEEVVGRTVFYQMVDSDILDPYLMRQYSWRVYAAKKDSSGLSATGYVYTTVASFSYNEVQLQSAPMCLIEGRVKRPDEQFPSDEIAKFYMDRRDFGYVVNGRMLSDEQVLAFINKDGRFGAYLLQDAVLVCHIPTAHVKLRFVVPRQARANLFEIPTTQLKYMNNL